MSGVGVWVYGGRWGERVCGWGGWGEGGRVNLNVCVCGGSVCVCDGV